MDRARIDPDALWHSPCARNKRGFGPGLMEFVAGTSPPVLPKAREVMEFPLYRYRAILERRAMRRVRPRA